MDFYKDILPMIFSLAAIVLVLFLSYAVSKYLSKRTTQMAGSRNIKILEKALLGTDKGLAIIEVCKQVYLVAFTGSHIEILKELPDYQPASPVSGQFGGFGNIFMDKLKAHMGKETGEKDGYGGQSGESGTDGQDEKEET